MAKETAEQKLLKLIEATDSKEKETAVKDQPASESEAQKVLSSVKSVGVPSIKLPAGLQNILTILQNPGNIVKTVSSFGLKEINNILLAGIFIVAVLFVLNVSSGMKHSSQDVYFPLEDNIEFSMDNLLPKFKEMVQYVDGVSRRNVFQPFERKVVEEEKELPDELKGIEKVLDRTKELKLVGISWLDTPESASAMIENTTSGITYFLRTGDNIQGVKVKEIFVDSIIIIYDGEEMEMQL